jgi:hypothetical protein
MDQYLDPEALAYIENAQALGTGGQDGQMDRLLDKLADLPGLIRSERGDAFDEEIDDVLLCMNALEAKRS